MLAVVRQQSVSLFAQAGARTFQHFATFESPFIGADSRSPISCKLRKRYFFHRPPAQSVCKPRVMDDATATDVDSVVFVKGARGDEVSCQLRLLARLERKIGPSASRLAIAHPLRPERFLREIT